MTVCRLLYSEQYSSGYLLEKLIYSTHPSESDFWWGRKGTWNKVQTGNPLGQVGASSGPILHSHSRPLLLCPPAAPTGLPVQKQKSHLVFVWDSSQAGCSVCLCVSAIVPMYECSYVSLCFIGCECSNLYLFVKSNKLQVEWQMCEICTQWVASCWGLIYCKATVCLQTPLDDFITWGVCVVWSRCVCMICVYQCVYLYACGV